MNYKIVSTKNFRKQAKSLIKKYPSLKDEILEITAKLEEDPKFGTSLGNNCYKIRNAIASKNKGKSGGARIITYIIVADNSVYMVSIYDKSSQESLTESELKYLVSNMEIINN